MRYCRCFPLTRMRPWAAGTAPLPLSPHYVFNAERNDAAVGLT